MSLEGNFEKTRIQNQDEAHEEANMLRFEVGNEATVEDYDRALALLDELEAKTSTESSNVSNIRDFAAKLASGSFVGIGSAGELIGLAIMKAGATVGPYPKNMKEHMNQSIAEQLKRIVDNYEGTKIDLSSARTRLEKWKLDAEESAKQQESAEEFNKRQAEQK